MASKGWTGMSHSIARVTPAPDGEVVLVGESFVDGLAVCLHGGRELLGRRSRHADVLAGGAGVEQCGQCDGRGDSQDHQEQ